MRVFEHSAMDQGIIILEFQDSKILMTCLVFCHVILKLNPEKIGIFLGCSLKVFFMRMMVQTNLDLTNLTFPCLNCLMFVFRKKGANLKV